MQTSPKRVDRLASRMRAVAFAFTLIAAVTTAPELPAQAEAAELRPQLIEWRPVAGARGYRVEWKQPGAAAVQRADATTPEIKLQLAPGEYEVRIAGLNVFGAPGRFSPWLRFRVYSRSEEESGLATGAVQQGGGIAIRSADQGAAGRGFPWRALVPGWEHFRRDSWLRGALWLTALGGVAAYGWNQKTLGDARANEAEALNLPLLYGAAYLADRQEYALLFSWQRNALRAQYDLAQNAQRRAAYLFVALYALQILDAWQFLGTNAAADRSHSDHAIEAAAMVLPERRGASAAFALRLRF